jgi:hypothetical protein
MFNPQYVSSPLIWFLLEDSSGQPYKGTSADYVSLASGSVIAQFRDAVKAKHSNKLSTFDAADLLVYKNKLAFGNRNEPLKEKVLYFTKDRKCRSKKTLSLMVWEAQRRKLSLSSFHQSSQPKSNLVSHHAKSLSTMILAKLLNSMDGSHFFVPFHLLP